MDDGIVNGLQAAVDAGKCDQIAELVERYWGQLIRSDDSLLYTAIEALPGEVRDQHPAAVLAAEVFYPLNPSVRRIGDPHICRIVKSFDETADNQLRVSRGIAALVAMKRRGNFTAAADFGSTVANAAELALAPTGPNRVRPETVAAAFLHAGAVDLMAGRYEVAKRHLTGAVRKQSPVPSHAFDAAGKLALIHALQGETHLARTWLAHADQIAKKADNSWRFAPAEQLAIDAACMLMAVDRMDWTEFHRHNRAVDSQQPNELWAFVLYARARAALALGTQRDAIHHIQQYRSDLAEVFTARGIPRILSNTAEADLWMSLNNYQEAGRLVDGFGDHPLEDITAARYYLLTRTPDLAQIRTDPHRWPVPLSRRNRLDLALLAATAHLRLHLHDAQRIELLRQAAIAVADEVKPWLFTFTLTDTDVLQLLGQHFPQVAPILAAAAEQVAANPFGRAEHAVRLTHRERLLLQYLALDFKLGEIAAELQLSPATIFNHRKNLYRKLGATSRDHAVEIGRRAGLINYPDTSPGHPRQTTIRTTKEVSHEYQAKRASG